ncbi:ABC-type molybdate transport system substrate-binding protein [Bradyrhizobium sp. USDA 4503]
MKLARLILINSLTRLVLATQAANINVAVAANFIEPDKEIAAAFKQKHGHEPVMSFGAAADGSTTGSRQMCRSRCFSRPKTP